MMAAATELGDFAGVLAMLAAVLAELTLLRDRAVAGGMRAFR
jgi:hypothetical protein